MGVKAPINLDTIMAERIDDTRWVRGLFGTAPFARDIRSSRSRYNTSADTKFADTTLGGNQAINPLPQFTRFADLKATGLLATPNILDPKQSATAFENENGRGSYRLGRKYSETIDDNAQYLHMRFGVPKYTGMITYFANVYDREMGRLAKTGEYSSVMRTAGSAVGIYSMFMVFGSAVMIPVIIVGQVLKLALNKKPSKFYYLKPTMNLYLQALQSQLDTQLLHSRMVPMWDFIGKDRYNDITEDSNINKSAMNDIYSLLPTIWKSDGKFDVYRMLNRYQVLANYQSKVLETIYASAANADDYTLKVKEYIRLAKQTDMMKSRVDEKNLNLYELARAYENNPMYQVNAAAELAEQEAWNTIQSKWIAANDGSTDAGVTSADISNEQVMGSGAGDEYLNLNKEDTTFKSFWNGIVGDASTQLVSELYDGAQWMTFRVDAKSTKSDSFSNSTTTPEIDSLMNSLSSAARSANVSAAGGKTGIDLIDSSIAAVSNFVGGLVDTVNITGLSMLFGGAIAEFPEVWEASSTQIATESFTIALRPPYGNDISLFQSITVPLHAILTGVLPLATGKQSYTAPFLCECYSRGRQIVRMGIIDSVSITRGVGNMGWRGDGRMLGCDITVNIKDLSKVMSMGVLKDPSILDDDNMFTDYMATLGAASLTELTYGLSKLIFNINKYKQSWKSAAQVGRVVNSVGNMEISRILSGLTAGVAK